MEILDKHAFIRAGREGGRAMEQALRALDRSFFALLFRECVRSVRDRDVARDLVQETFVKVWQRCSTFHGESDVRLETSERECGVTVAVPRLPEGLTEEEVWRAQRALVDELLLDGGVSDYVAWFYTPMALAFAGHLRPRAVVYDCMDELSAFKNAPAALRQYESELFSRADLVFTGGGVLASLRDLDQWASGIATALKPGGTLLLYDSHPVTACVDPLGHWRDQYFERTEERPWRLEEIVDAVVGAGLGVTRLAEFQTLYNWVQRDRRVPWEFALLATKQS